MRSQKLKIKKFNEERDLYLPTNRLKEEVILHSLGRLVDIVVVASKDE